jgi:hypothetical protein
MSIIHPGRHTTRIDGAFVVFLIGFRINRLRAIRRWLPVAKAMGQMLRELSAYAQARDAAHLPRRRGYP